MRDEIKIGTELRSQLSGFPSPMIVKDIKKEDGRKFALIELIHHPYKYKDIWCRIDTSDDNADCAHVSTPRRGAGGCCLGYDYVWVYPKVSEELAIARGWVK